MALTKKHFKLFAEMIKEERLSIDALEKLGCPSRLATDELNIIASKIAHICQDENPNFSALKFFGACEVKVNE